MKLSITLRQRERWPKRTSEAKERPQSLPPPLRFKNIRFSLSASKKPLALPSVTYQ